MTFDVQTHVIDGQVVLTIDSLIKILVLTKAVHGSLELDALVKDLTEFESCIKEKYQ